MATADIRFKRMQGEYRTLQDAQNRLFDKVDRYEAALLGLNEVVTENRERLERVEETVAENREMLQAIIEHLEVPYKPPMGFTKE